MKHFIRFILIVVFAFSAGLAAAEPAGHLNLDDKKVAIHGYDPVSYFKTGPAKGKKEFALNYDGATYLFVDQANLDTFKADPDSYLPAFGGWCAWAMLDGEKVDVDPETYKIVDGKNYLFYNFFFTNTLTKWNDLAEKKNEEALIKQANNKWNEIMMQ